MSAPGLRVPAELVAPGARLVDAGTGERLAGAALDARLDELAGALAATPPGPLLALTDRSLGAVLRFLAAFRARRPVALLDPSTEPGRLADLAARFRPGAVLGAGALPAGAPVPAGYRAAAGGVLGPVWHRVGDGGPPPHPDLAVLLATSGSTGSPKLARLSRTAVLANAAAIGQALVLGPDEVAPTTLPLFYSYGLSVLTSHLAAGATVVVLDAGLLDRELWAAVDEHRASSFAGVPYHYQALARVRWSPARHPSLRTLTQAGGRLPEDLVGRFARAIGGAGGRMYVMYGQTEATARIAVLPPDRLDDKLGSVGVVVPGGSLSIEPPDGAGPAAAPPGTVGEVVYRGPNVMLGYARSAADLGRGDELRGRLPTGDLGHLDPEGFLFLSGRRRRVGKVFGVLVGLDDVEGILRSAGPVAAVAAGDKVVIWCERADGERCRRMAETVARRLRLHRSGFDVRSLDRLPLTAAGKIDYRRLEAL